MKTQSRGIIHYIKTPQNAINIFHLRKRMMMTQSRGIILSSLLFSTKIIRFSIQHLPPAQIPYFDELTKEEKNFSFEKILHSIAPPPKKKK